MNKTILILLFFFLFISAGSYAQTNAWPGTWQMQYSSNAGLSAINIELQIASPERNILYPAILKLQCDSFKAQYELLLVKKSIRELAISKNKYPVYEKPFSLGEETSFLNGVFDDSRGAQGVPTLTLIRIQPNQYKINPADTMHLDKAHKLAAIRIMDFLKEGNIILKKINDSTWGDEDADRITSPSLSPVYFGLKDTIHLQNRDGEMNLTSSKKTSNDTVSIALNGQIIVDQLTLNKKIHTEDIFLNPGLNILTFFADNFGNTLPNKGKLNLDFGNKKFDLDFNNKADSAATFIVAKLYYDVDKSKEKNFKDYTPSASEVKPLEKNEKLIGGIITADAQINLAVWDDAVEDGDSVSISIDGRWIVQGFRAKNDPQQITVTLKPGLNTITYIADNLGSIPPSTTMLEIIDGNKRRPFLIRTAPGEKNFIKIFYDPTAYQ